MTDENKIVEVKPECFCKSKWFRKFLVTALGSFVGVFCALSLFAALHKPPMPPCTFGPQMMMRPPMHAHHHMNHHRGHHFNHHRDEKGCCDHQKMPNRVAPDKVKVEVKG